MKFTAYVTDEREEEVIVYTKQRTKLVDEIERLVSDCDLQLIGYTDKYTVALTPDEVYCFIVDSGKIYALTENEKLQLKCRLYHLEETLSQNFVKINQSCIANIRKIERFDTSISGTMLVIFKNSHKDYVSRRQMKTVKERLGL
ncbi:MAG: LytTR family transcriptional regulator DNA-binding domain-containing protein [Clostridia bacterium]|nr:LytTR family transcriptional regulator DNA-binding domain-containing protein [Clostridia bacterium]